MPHIFIVGERVRLRAHVVYKKFQKRVKKRDIVAEGKKKKKQAEEKMYLDAREQAPISAPSPPP